MRRRQGFGGYAGGYQPPSGGYYDWQDTTYDPVEEYDYVPTRPRSASQAVLPPTFQYPVGDPRAGGSYQGPQYDEYDEFGYDNPQSMDPQHSYVYRNRRQRFAVASAVDCTDASGGYEGYDEPVYDPPHFTPRIPPVHAPRQFTPARGGPYVSLRGRGRGSVSRFESQSRSNAPSFTFVPPPPPPPVSDRVEPRKRARAVAESEPAEAPPTSTDISAAKSDVPANLTSYSGGGGAEVGRDAHATATQYETDPENLPTASVRPKSPEVMDLESSRVPELPSFPAELWVGNLPAAASESDVTGIFTRIGLVPTRVELSPVETVRGSSRSAIVLLPSESDAHTAQQFLHGRTHNGRDLEVLAAIGHSKQLFISGFGPEVTDSQLCEALQQYDRDITEESVRIHRDAITHASTGVATVTFKRRVAGGRLELLFRNHMFVLNGSSRPLQASVRPPEETDCLRVLKPKTYCPMEDAKHVQLSGHFAMPNSLEFEFGRQWRQLLHTQRIQRLLLAQEQQTAQDALHKAQIAAAKEQLHLMERLQELKTTIQRESEVTTPTPAPTTFDE